MKELKKLARITAKSGLLVIMFLSDSRTDVSLISSRLISGTRSLILKKPNTANTAARISIKYAKPEYTPSIVMFLFILGRSAGTSDGSQVPKSSKNFVMVIRSFLSSVLGVML